MIDKKITYVVAGREFTNLPEAQEYAMFLLFGSLFQTKEEAAALTHSIMANKAEVIAALTFQP